MAVLVTLFGAASAGAAPDLPLDDPSYLEVYRLQDLGLVPTWSLSATRPLTESNVRRLLVEAGQRPSEFLLSPELSSLWVKPAARVTTRLAASDDEPRLYSVPARPRDMVGGVELACEHQEGRPCGDGVFGLLELDSSAGYGPWVAAYSRLQFGAASGDPTTTLRADRLYSSLELGPVRFLIGRNVVGVGPGRHTQLLWGDQPPPLDQVALSIAGLRLPGLPLTIGAAYVLGRLAPPQHFAHSLVTLSRAYVDIADHLSLGISNLLEFGGEGAPPLTFWQFVEEHVKRAGPGTSEGASNRRLGFDAKLNLPWIRSTFYTEFVFEDWRSQFGSTLAYDIDYLLGWSTSALGHEQRHGFLVEFVRTGVRSQEHGLFNSGMTSGGRVVGPPLGPDALSLYVSPHWDIGTARARLAPWAEFVRIGSDTYVFPSDGPISRLSSGPFEIRLRSGVQLSAAVQRGLWLQSAGFVERVKNEAFGIGERNNGGVSVGVTWYGSEAVSLR